MKVQEVERNSTNKILLGLIISDEFLSKYVELFSEDPIFKEIGASWIERTCVSYFRRYRKAPNKEMVSLYDQAVENKRITPEELSYVEKLLCKLSEEQDSVNSEFLIDEAIVEANVRKVKSLSNILVDVTSKDNINKVLEKIESFKKVEAGETLPVISLFDSAKVCEEVYQQKQESLVSFDGAFGLELNPLIRPNTVTYLRAPAKGLKSYGVFHIALNALLNKHNIAIFELGDLSEGDTFGRLLTAMSGRPVEVPSAPFYNVSEPDCLYNEYNKCMSINRTCVCARYLADGSQNTEYKPCTYCSKVNKPFPITSLTKTKQSFEVLTKEKSSSFLKILSEKFSDNVFDVYTYSTYSCSVSKIREICEKKAKEGVPYELVVLDHFGLLAPEKSTMRSESWQVAELQSRLIRKLSQDFNIAVVVADQMNIRMGLDEDGLQSDTSYSSTSAKNQDATAIVGINRDKFDIQNGTLRLATVLSRSGNLTSINGGYIQVNTNITEGIFCDKSMYVSPACMEVIKKAKEEFGIIKVEKKFKK